MRACAHVRGCVRVCVMRESAYTFVHCISLQEFFENPAFRADGLKIYPTLVIRGTGR